MFDDNNLAAVLWSLHLFLLQMKELDIPKSTAERGLREHNGDLIKTLHTLTD